MKTVSYFKTIGINQMITLLIMRAIGGQISMGSQFSPGGGRHTHASQLDFSNIQFKRAFHLRRSSDEYISCAYSRQSDITAGGTAPAWEQRRTRALPRLIPVGPDDVSDRSVAGRMTIVRRLMRSLRGERMRGRAGHWSYDLNRHIGLVEALKCERGALRRLAAATTSLARAAGVPQD